LWLPLLAKACEVTLLNINDLVTLKANANEHHVRWEASGSSLDSADAFKSYTVNGRVVNPTTVARGEFRV
jgi:hypothetical protein